MMRHHRMLAARMPAGHYRLRLLAAWAASWVSAAFVIGVSMSPRAAQIGWLLAGAILTCQAALAGIRWARGERAPRTEIRGLRRALLDERGRADTAEQRAAGLAADRDHMVGRYTAKCVDLDAAQRQVRHLQRQTYSSDATQLLDRIDAGDDTIVIPAVCKEVPR